LLADSPHEVQVGYQKLTELLRLLDIQAQIAVELTELSDEEDGETYILQIQGQNLNLLIGRRGETLSSLQYLTRMLAAKDLEKHPTFIVDVGRYKLRRTEKLYELAHRLANQAVAQGRVIKLEPMPAHERRIIHMALRQRRDVKTESVGEGRLRKVTLIPQ
jgi:spoIIIJ-associated protein